jgi:DNA-binding NarL/FixJ family response regulator
MEPVQNMPITVAIVEDDAPLRASLAGILQRATECRCVGAYASAEDALREIPALLPQVVLMDINLPGMDGVQCVRRLAELVPRAQILMLTVHEDPDSIFESLAAGASGYLLKPVRAAELVAAVKDVYAGGAPMTSNIARKVVKSFKRAGAEADEAKQLSPRERDVLDYLVKGYSYKEVADQMGISYSTVHTHIEHIYQKLHVQSRAQAVAKYLRV